MDSNEQDRDPNFRGGIDGNAMEQTCGFSRTPEVEGTNCGAPALLHHFFGTGWDDPRAFMGYSCTEHAAYSARHSYDWHDVKAVCGMPDTVWINSDGLQGTSWCVWPVGETVADEVARESEVHA